MVVYSSTVYFTAIGLFETMVVVCTSVGSGTGGGCTGGGAWMYVEADTEKDCTISWPRSPVDFCAA